MQDWQFPVCWGYCLFIFRNSKDAGISRSFENLRVYLPSLAFAVPAVSFPSAYLPCPAVSSIPACGASQTNASESILSLNVLPGSWLTDSGRARSWPNVCPTALESSVLYLTKADPPKLLCKENTLAAWNGLSAVVGSCVHYGLVRVFGWAEPSCQQGFFAIANGKSSYGFC